MADDENSHYTGKVEKYEDGRVLFRLDTKIGEFRRPVRRMKRSISFDDSDFYILSGIDVNNGEKINVGKEYKIDRKELYNIIEGRLKEKKEKNNKGKPIDDELDLSEFVKDGEISGTGILGLLSEGDEKDEDN